MSRTGPDDVRGVVPIGQRIHALKYAVFDGNFTRRAHGSATSARAAVAFHPEISRASDRFETGLFRARTFPDEQSATAMGRDRIRNGRVREHQHAREEYRVGVTWRVHRDSPQICG